MHDHTIAQHFKSSGDVVVFRVPGQLDETIAALRNELGGDLLMFRPSPTTVAALNAHMHREAAWRNTAATAALAKFHYVAPDAFIFGPAIILQRTQAP